MEKTSYRLLFVPGFFLIFIWLLLKIVPVKFSYVYDDVLRLIFLLFTSFFLLICFLLFLSSNYIPFYIVYFLFFGQRLKE